MMFWCTYCKRTIVSDEIRRIRVDTHLSTCEYFNPEVKGDSLSPINEKTMMNPICPHCNERHPENRICEPEAKHLDDEVTKTMEEVAIRNEIGVRYDSILPEFLRMMAMIGHYADQKYGRWDNYQDSRLTGNKSPINHIMDHLIAYQLEEGYDHFDGHNNWNLAAIAYNAMMEWFYANKESSGG